MIRLIASCLWIIAVTTMSAYVTATWQLAGAGNKTPADSLADLQRKKTAVINVPMIASGKAEGYIVAQFVYLADGKELREMPIPPDDFVADEAFRLLYSNKVDFNNLEKFDLQSLTRTLTQKVNERVRRDIVKDILVVEFAYVAKPEIAR
jgi:hypothetical protein